MASPNTVNQSPGANGVTTPSTPVSVTPSKNPAAQEASTVATSNGWNASQSLQDYTKRTATLGDNVNKIALIGRSGKGSINDVLGTSTNSSTASIMSKVIFEATPDMQESGRSILVDIGDIRAAASVVFYMGSPSRSFSLDAKFISRTTAEASQNMAYINTLKAWRMPMISNKTGSSDIGHAVPETLRLYAYGTVIRGIPCMIESLNITYPSDVDYIKTTLNTTSGISTSSANGTGSGSTIWVPIIQNVSISLKEVRSYNDLKAFDYDQFKAGVLPQW